MRAPPRTAPRRPAHVVGAVCGHVAGLGCLLIASGCRAERSEPPTRPAAAELLRRLDAAFDARDADAYFASWTRSHPLQRARRRAELDALFTAPNPLLRSSAVIAELWRDGDFGVARVEREYACARGGGRAHEQELVAFRVAGSEPQALFEIAVDGALLDVLPAGPDGRPSDTFACEPCNYRFRAPSGWLLVPHAARRSGCGESLSCIAYERDVSVDLSIAHDGRPAPARERLAEFVRAEYSRQPDALVAWTPPALAAAPDSRLDGAACELTLPCGTAARIHVASHGPLLYVFAVRGSAAALAEHREHTDRLLTGFQILDPARDPAGFGSDGILAHSGGRCDEGTYTNAPHRVRFSGPRGWPQRGLDVDALFAIEWTDPDGCGRVALHGYRAEGSDPAQRRRHARATVERAIRAGGLVLERSAEWHDCEQFGSAIVLRGSAGTGAAERAVAVRVQVADDMFAVVEIDGADADAVRAIEQTLAPVERTP